MQRISLQHEPPSHGWVRLQLCVEGRNVGIDASDVPNNPIQELVEAIESTASGRESCVWWHLEPDGYFMYFTPIGKEVELRLEFAPSSERNRSQAILSFRGSRAEVLLPFWRFLREFQSRSYVEPHWPSVNYERIHAIKEAIGGASEA